MAARARTAWLMIGAALWGAGILPACDEEEEDPPPRSCEESCEAAKQCPEGTGPRFNNDDCAVACANYRTIADAAGCPDADDNMFECIGDSKDVCDVSQVCIVPGFEFAFCLGPYCSEHETLPECKGMSCSSAATIGMDCTVTRRCTGEPELTLTCAGAECTCATDGMPGASVPYQPAFCEGEIDAQVDAAAAACGWEL